MADRRLDEIVADWDLVIAQREVDIAEKNERNRRQREFSEAWRVVYTDASLQMTDEVAQAITQRLLHLAGLMREQFWDFRLAELLQDSDKPALRARCSSLAHPCRASIGIAGLFGAGSSCFLRQEFIMAI